MKKTFLVTGAAGFIGAAVVQKLIDREFEVVTIDNLSTGFKEHIPSNVEFIEGSTFDPEIIQKLNGRKFDAIIHIAGQSSGEVSFENPVYDLQTNCQSTLMLLDYARKTGCNKFVYASTMSVYGDRENPECTEDSFLEPKSFYAVGKIASENYMRIFSDQFGMTCTALRLFNTYGEGQNLYNLKQGMVSIYLAMAIKEHEILVKGSKDRFRDFVYIDDVAEAFVRAIDRDGGYECMNVCTNKSTTVEQVVSEITKHLPYEVSVEYSGGTPGDQFGIYGNNKKISTVLNWMPKISFELGIEKMVSWAIDQLSER